MIELAFSCEIPQTSRLIPNLLQDEFSAFSKLLNLLREVLRVDAKKSRNRTSNQDPIGPEMILHCTLHYLSGGSYLDVMIHTGISRAAFYSCVYRGVDAICKCPDLQLKMPTSISEMKVVASGFESLSLDGRLNGSIGALDGWLCPIKVPSQKEAYNVGSNFSGHYQSYGVNVQATCDCNSCFTSIVLSFVLVVQVTVKHMLQATCTPMSPIYLSVFISLRIMHIHYLIRF